MSALPATGVLAGLIPIFEDIGALKRVRRAGAAEPVASTFFLRAWSALARGGDPKRIAVETTSLALAAARLGAIDAGVLASAKLCEADRLTILLRGFDHAARTIDAGQRERLRAALVHALPAISSVAAPSFAWALAAQPRAGATALGARRFILEPAESHADHCLAVAVYGVLAAPRFGADETTVFLLALAHHLHNASLPDAGFAGEQMLGEFLEPIVESFTMRALGELPSALARHIAELRPLLREAESAESRAFHAADVIDRVLEVRHFAHVAAFEVSQALDELELVHAGPIASFHASVLAETHLV